MTTIYCDVNKLPERRLFDAYPTPGHVIEGALDLIPGAPQRIIDCCAGDGAWGTLARERWPQARICGVEIQTHFPKPTAYSDWRTGDFMEMGFLTPCADLVIGNPPYKFAEPLIRKSFSLLYPGGSLIFLLRLAFLEGQARRDGLYAEIPLYEVAVCSKRPSFTSDGKTNATAFGIFHFKKDFLGEPTIRWLK